MRIRGLSSLNYGSGSVRLEDGTASMGSCMSQCVPLVAKHDKLGPGEREEAARFYGDAALKVLREAVRRGYNDVPHMKKDTDLDPLRQRPDFQKLLAELEGKGK